MILLLLLITTPLLAQKYVLKDGSEQLVEFVEKQITDQKIDKNPVIVINEAVVKGPYLEALSFSSEDIVAMFVFEKGKEHLVTLYGAQAINGVISITTKVGKATDVTFDQKDTNSLIYIDGMLATKDAMAALQPDDILHINVIKDAKEIATYTNQFYTGIIQITTKKK